MDAVVSPLIAKVSATIRLLLIRTTPASGDYLEGVLAAAEVERCCELLTQVLGPPVKPFGAAVALEPAVRRIVERLGGIRQDQCLYLQAQSDGHGRYAALWPWASDPNRVTLKIGVLP